MTAATTAKLTLYERIAKVQSGLEDISATGSNQFKARALSISDVEGALRKPLADAGIVTRWSYVELAQLEAGLWRAHLKVTVCSTDAESDLFEDEWIDIGGNPMAATSFARKGYLKALFHITEEGDEQGRTETRTEPQRQAEPARTAIPPARTQPRNGAPRAELCVQCQAEGLKSRKGYPPKYWPRPDGSLQCDGIDVDGSFANHHPQVATFTAKLTDDVQRTFTDEGVPTPTDADR